MTTLAYICLAAVVFVAVIMLGMAIVIVQEDSETQAGIDKEEMLAAFNNRSRIFNNESQS